MFFHSRMIHTKNKNETHRLSYLSSGCQSAIQHGYPQNKSKVRCPVAWGDPPSAIICSQTVNLTHPTILQLHNEATTTHTVSRQLHTSNPSSQAGKERKKESAGCNCKFLHTHTHSVISRAQWAQHSANWPGSPTTIVLYAAAAAAGEGAHSECVWWGAPPHRMYYNEHPPCQTQLLIKGFSCSPTFFCQSKKWVLSLFCLLPLFFEPK